MGSGGGFYRKNRGISDFMHKRDKVKVPKIIDISGGKMMEYYRYVLLVLESEDKKDKLLNEIPGWEYCDKLENSLKACGYSFKLINRTENIQVYFKKIKDGVYTSINVLPYDTGQVDEIAEPQEKNICNDILFQLCRGIRDKFANWEIRCGIIPCEND